jgi:hypothetical protein
MQAQTMEADVIFHLRKQRFDLLPLALCMLELRCCTEIAGSLLSCLIHVDSEISAAKYSGSLASARSPSPVPSQAIGAKAEI